MEHIHVIGEGFVDRVVAQHATELQHLGVRRIAGVLQDAPGQQIIFQIRRTELGTEGAVHVEDRDAVGGRDVVRRGFIRHGLHIVDQRAQRGGAVVPVRKNFLGRTGRGPWREPDRVRAAFSWSFSLTKYVPRMSPADQKQKNHNIDIGESQFSCLPPDINKTFALSG